MERCALAPSRTVQRMATREASDLRGNRERLTISKRRHRVLLLPLLERDILNVCEQAARKQPSAKQATQDDGRVQR